MVSASIGVVAVWVLLCVGVAEKKISSRKDTERF